MKTSFVNPLKWIICSGLVISSFASCQKEAIVKSNNDEVASEEAQAQLAPSGAESIFLVIDEESIDNGNQPNNFSATDVNDHLARVGLRQQLSYFRRNVGRTIDLFTGEVGDEGWHALKTIPAAWRTAGPTTNGTRNFLKAGPGLGGGTDGPEVLLDKIPNVTPLRARGLAMLTGKTVLAVVYDGDVTTNYGPLNANLQGANLGVVALQVLEVRKRTDGSSGSLPRVKVKIVSVDAAIASNLKLFSNAPAPRSSSEPFDVTPPAAIPTVTLVNAQ